MQPKGQIRSKFGEVFQLAATNPGEEPIKSCQTASAHPVQSLLLQHVVG
jgi:hypothetical protein